MQIKNEKPPIYDKVKKVLDFDERHTVFTYGDCIYNPAGITVTMDLHIHESTHQIQQQRLNILKRWLGPWRWWRRYLKDDKFRFDQELQAYRMQYGFMGPQIKDRNQRNDYLVALARQLMSPMYGSLKVDGGLYGAMKLIKQRPLGGK
jgi:hypothetical protein